jgi:hypothetical protein
LRAARVDVATALPAPVSSSHASSSVSQT